MGHHEIIYLTVEYTGKAPFHEKVRNNLTFHEVKLQAMKAFDLEEAAAKKYVLQFEGTDLDEGRHVDSLGKEHLTLHLTLKHEPVKGAA